MAVLLLVLMVSSATLAAAWGNVAPINYCDRTYSCLNCTGVRMCAPTSDKQHLYEISRFSCPTSNPYCNYTTGSCSTSIDPACYSPTPNATVANFTCMRDGYFPDPRNCSVYYYCQDEVAYQYTCSYPTQYYHPGLKYCTNNRQFCTDYSSSYYCNYNSYYGKKFPIYYTSNYFLYCGVNSILAVDKCIGDYYFSLNAQMCQFTCPNKGLFLKDDDCANYFKCSPDPYGSGYTITNMTCPAGQAFLESEYSCVDRSRVPNCNAPYSDLFSK